MLTLPPQKAVDRSKPEPPFTIPDPDFRFRRGDIVFEVVYGCLPADPQYFAFSPRMPQRAGS
jgi:hypothetical protein